MNEFLLVLQLVAPAYLPPEQITAQFATLEACQDAGYAMLESVPSVTGERIANFDCMPVRPKSSPARSAPAGARAAGG
jgi:hypothetical protein